MHQLIFQNKAFTLQSNRKSSPQDTAKYSKPLVEQQREITSLAKRYIKDIQALIVRLRFLVAPLKKRELQKQLSFILQAFLGVWGLMFKPCLILNLIKGWIKSAPLIVVTIFPFGICIAHYSKPSGVSSNSLLVLQCLVIFQIPNNTITL